MANAGPSDYRQPQTQPGLDQHGEGILDQVSEKTREAGESASAVATEGATAVKEHPFTAVAVAAGLAFVVGALWKTNQRHTRSRRDDLLANMPDLPSLDRLKEMVARQWR